MLIDFVLFFYVHRSNRPLLNKKKQQQHQEKVKAASHYDEKYNEKKAVTVKTFCDRKNSREYAV